TDRLLILRSVLDNEAENRRIYDRYISPCGEIINGRQTLILSIADVVASKICTDEHTKSRLFLQAAFVVFNKKNL
ncbi:hypothetical protein KSX27_18750, partial [Acinetobacter baumannii]|uniref:hypothetical protein n=1 Tax=Acinetobacter baumannii TaxID=470 RepID=UPI001CA6B2D5